MVRVAFVSHRREVKRLKVVVDRFEGAYAVVILDDGTQANIPLVLLPDARESDVVLITIDKAATKQTRKRVEQLMQKVWADD